ncbi:MAG: hypothetical protein LBE56_12835 [Tannerella sp.]|jgi:hypothetical protein|nr:hypothetical protein [Tannerella sp.]
MVGDNDGSPLLLREYNRLYSRKIAELERLGKVIVHEEERWSDLAQLLSEEGKNPDDFGAYTVLDENTGVVHVFVNPKRKTTFSKEHEFIHVLTAQALENPKTKDDWELHDKMQELYDEFVSDYQADSRFDQYRISNLKEFVAYALTNREFQMLLEQRESVQGSGVQNSRLREEKELEKANERWNRELDDFKNKIHNNILHLGKPLSILKASGVNARELTISPTVLNRKMRQHNLVTDDLKNLAEAIQNPMFVYEHGTVHPNIVVITNINVKDKKLSIAIKLDNQGNVVEISNISSVHGKDAVTELERLSTGAFSGIGFTPK